jgi:thiol-disulfide isomerase/thioredoxin
MRRMSRPSTVLYSLLAGILILVIRAFAADETGQPAPRFRAKTTTGAQYNNASIKGKIVLFEFWTTWCKYCEEEASMVDHVANRT